MVETPIITTGLESNGRKHIVVRTPYHETFVEQLKQLPADDRAWDPTTHAWIVAASHQERVEQLVLRFWPSVQVNGGDGDYLLSRDGTKVEQARLL